MYDVEDLKVIDDMVYDQFMFSMIFDWRFCVFDMIDKYGAISIADLLDLLNDHLLAIIDVDIRKPKFVDRKFGWTSAEGFACNRLPYGLYRLVIPWDKIVDLEA